MVVTYEGKHSHMKPSQSHLSIGPIKPAGPGLPVIRSPAGSTITLDMVHPAGSGDPPKMPGQQGGLNIDQTPVLQHILVQQMASSLTRDPNFTAALAAAISGRIFDHSTDPMDDS